MFQRKPFDDVQLGIRAKGAATSSIRTAGAPDEIRDCGIGKYSQAVFRALAYKHLADGGQVCAAAHPAGRKHTEGFQAWDLAHCSEPQAMGARP